ncbi:LAFE_0B07514g1_1 [Lachancea fermentati]|uniref:LAFE_0B07514g1_1 n=1 Tax=Lachancea fermentati TaxID=4955 RepID=A0A1G4M8I8_LACFM|nr:LAFE_0B07514g1_1 [Lachancea fermentati]
MDELLAKAGSQAVTFAIKSGISIASSYAIKTVATFVTKVPEKDATNLIRLRAKLETRIEIVSSAIDLIKLVAAKGNTNLQSTLRLTSDLKEEIDSFDSKITLITENYQSTKNERESIVAVENYINGLLARIEEVIPLINLSLTTSGANLSTALPQHVSPGRLLQASNFLIKSNDAFNGAEKCQVGPTFELTLFSVFYHMVSSETKDVGKPRITWKEDMKKALVTIWRKPDERRDYDYSVRIQESFDDGRYHDTDEETPKLIELQIWQIIKLFFSASGKLLKLAERNSSVLVLKVDKNLKSPLQDDWNTSIQDIEWFALGEYEGEDASDSESDSTTDEEPPLAVVENEISHSIALLEYLLRLASLQCSDQQSVLEVHDERLSLYLNDENPNSVTAKRYNVEEIAKKLQEIDLKSA